MTKRKPTPRELLTTDLRVVIDELLDSYRTRELVPTVAVPSLAKQLEKGARLPSKSSHTTNDAGLLTQLENAAGTRGTDLLEPGPARGTRYGADTGGHSKPGSRPPMSLDALDTWTTITTAITLVRRSADHAARMPAHVAAMRRDYRGELRHLLWLVQAVDDNDTPLLTDAWVRRIYRDARGWSADARVALSYLAPIVTLQVPCPDCGGELKVRADATSDVWCSGVWTVEGPALEGKKWPVTYPHGASWPRITWVDLLAAKERA